jgi:hypothetical protein
VSSTSDDRFTEQLAVIAEMRAVIAEIANVATHLASFEEAHLLSSTKKALANAVALDSKLKALARKEAA